jgi:DNA-binding transcriptional MerR regulator
VRHANLTAPLLHIQLVSRLTSLTVDTIRAWEKRYAAVNPKRGRARHRLFTADDVARLVLLKEAVDGGASISSIATLGTPELRSFVEGERYVGDIDDAAISRLYKDVCACDRDNLTSHLETAALSRSAVEFADDIISPLMLEISARARSIDESTVRELFLCECIREGASSLFARYVHQRATSTFIFLTLPSERHAVPALLAAMVCAEAGHRSLFAGTEISPQQIEAIAHSMRVAGIGIYVGVHHYDALKLLRDVRKRLPHLPVFVGSHGSPFAPEIQATRTMREFVSRLRAADCLS